jgi:hypothetical protein
MRRNLSSIPIIIFIAILLASCGAFARGQSTAQAALPTADHILKRYVQALGGAAAYEKLTSRVSKGSFELAPNSDEAVEEIYEKAPNKLLMVTEVPDSGAFRFCFDGKSAWQETPQHGVEDIIGGQLEAMRLQADFYRAIRLEDIYPKRVVKGREIFNGHETYIVEATPVGGAPELWDFDVDSGLLLRTRGQAEGQNGPDTFETVLEDYREVGGIKLPFVYHTTRSDFSFFIRLTEVKHNVPIDDSKFAKPAEN